ncbi:hypothetical protein PMZ80_002617 [Knufia obscura]|uniref:DUF1479-domain-containing protein n=2 Tax=Knufia TaxID=430999 RepID=A0AAN8IKP7_9EURO|nr:hypothetical protein PMZ80_002617 [Knufia obscura]KAK5951397.1 hypothetical protein OHC33_007453 [Knufia fluminis]
MTAKVVARAASTLTKEAGDISSVFPSLSGKLPPWLPARYSDLKKNLIQGKEDAVTQSWHRLLSSLRREIAEVGEKGNKVVADVDFEDVANGTVPPSFLDSIRHRGVGIVRNVLPRAYALELKQKALEYIEANKSRIRAFPPDNPTVYELYWSPSQTLARGHPNTLKTQSFLTTLWHSSDPQSELSTTYPLAYADRLRIRQPGDAKFALGPHTDGGSLERWEDPTYSKVYQKILDGRWEEYDPYDARYRIDANMDLYNGAGACSMFRLFQGWLGMSSTGPGEGTLRVCPLLHRASAYQILRPFFNISTNELDLESPEFPGSVQAACQEYNTETHPHLELQGTMVSIPKVEPGDYVAWHCDTMHAVDAEHRGKTDSSVLYIPACAITRSNVEFLKRQRDLASRWSPPPDFPGAGGDGEKEFHGKVDWSSDFISPAAKRAMGFAGQGGFEVMPHMSVGERNIIQESNRLLFGM